ncbi:head GIN domain-containing protein [Pedobacter sp. AW31-3R]|uniref:head GIN domain-containing protein n=1 Tax=Pedobacter sp. AW31-3R TaxID=3445781 RepID=UPI003F9FC6AB
MKTSYFIKLTILFFIGIAWNGQVVSAQETKKVAVSNFSGVSVSTGIDLYLSQGSSESAKIVASEGAVNEVQVEVKDNNLVIKFRESRGFTNAWKNRNAKVYVTYKTLNSISATSGSSAITENLLKANKLVAKATSGADLKLELKCNELEVQTTSGADADLSGTATNISFKSTSGSDINAYRLAADYGRVTATSGADIKVNVNKGLETTSNSGGSIRYKGTASLNDHSPKNTGSVHRAD